MVFREISTVQEATALPHRAVTVALPPATAVTLPFASTAATEDGSLDQVTVLSVALSGRTVAVRAKDSPTNNSRVLRFSSMKVAVMMRFFTVTETDAFFPPASAVMMAEPSWRAVTSPIVLTAAMVSSEEDQVMPE